MAPNLTVEKLLPIEAIGDKEGDKNKEKSETQVDYIYEQPEAQLLDKLLPRYVETQILRAMLESSASEYAARMTAMESDAEDSSIARRICASTSRSDNPTPELQSPHHP